MPVIDLFCVTCRAVTRYEQPPCADDHGADCPEWFCVACGDASLIGATPLPASPPGVPVGPARLNGALPGRVRGAGRTLVATAPAPQR